jgi:hypothetical protein
MIWPCIEENPEIVSKKLRTIISIGIAQKSTIKAIKRNVLHSTALLGQ